MKRCGFIFLLTALLMACSSFEKGNPINPSEAPLFGMIYDSESNPVNGAEVVLDGESKAHTDVNGRVLFNDVALGKHRIVIRNDGFETAKIELDFFNRDQVLYTTLISMQHILDELEASLEAEKYYKAQDLVSRAESVDPENVRFRYLKTVYLYRVNEYTTALEVIEGLLQRYPGEPNLLMTKASIMYAGLNKKSEARALLQEYLETNKNKEMAELIDSLEKEEANE